MPSRPAQSATSENVVTAASGWVVLLLNAALLVAGVSLLVFFARQADAPPALAIAGVLCELLTVFTLLGYFTLQPNQARVLILFGAYRGTVRESGFFWANPFYSRTRGGSLAGAVHAASVRKTGSASAAFGYSSTKISLRANNFASQTLKVNDKRGNPVEIGAVVVWRVEDTAQAVFDVENYTTYVEIQSESAIRSIASHYAYDNGEDHEVTLRGGADEVAQALKQELQVRLEKAGVRVEDARLSHLAYAPEIAPAMLRRQQAEAVIAARKIIVQNAVVMVHTALNELESSGVVRLDDERRAAMVSNLLVVLCGSNEASPVINTGTLYS